MQVNCPVCIGSSQCYKCQIKQLNNTIRELRKKLEVYDEHILADHLLIPPDNANFRVKQSNKPLDNLYPIEQSQIETYYFVTLTFDPAKFGTHRLDQHRKDYILHQLMILYDKELIKNFYGCFEHHDSGIIHAHVIIKTYNPSEVYQLLQVKFTDNNRNKRAVQLVPAKIPNAIKYINKESSNYFLKVNKQTFRRVIEEYESDSSSESSQENPLDVIL